MGLAAGNYLVTPVPAAAFPLYVLCSLNRTATFTIDLANSTLVLMVRCGLNVISVPFVSYGMMPMLMKNVLLIKEHE